MYRTVLVGLDGSDLSEEALRQAIDLARAGRGRVLAVHVIPETIPVVAAGPGPVTPDLMTPAMTPELLEEIRRAGETIVDRAREVIAASGASGEARLVTGDPAGQLVEIAKAEGADLVAVGSRGHSRLEEIFLGSVSDALSRRAPCSVLIVR